LLRLPWLDDSIIRPAQMCKLRRRFNQTTHAALTEFAQTPGIFGPSANKPFERRMMTKMIFGLSFGFAALIFATQHAFAGANCAERSVVLNELAGKYHETRRAMGIAPDTVIMELFASADTGTWTLTVTTTDGTTCLVASGNGYQALAEDLPPPGDPV
jgi:hypothetical protein